MKNLAAPSPVLHRARQPSALPMPSYHDRLLAGWMIEVAAGSRPAFKVLYQATSAKLLGIILRLLRDRQESEDVLQEVYVKVWRTAASYDVSRGRPMTWLITIARHRAIDRLRARRPQTNFDLDYITQIPDRSPSAEALLTMLQEARMLEAALTRLPPHFASAIRSAYLDGTTYAALAAAQGVPVGTLKSWVHRGVAMMRQDFLRSSGPSSMRQGA